MADLTELLVELRAELRGETPILLHTHRVPKLRTPDGEDDRKNADEGGIGPPFTAAFHRRLSHRDWWGIDELALRSIAEVGDWCRSRHQSDLHRSPGRSTSLCERIVSGLAEHPVPVGQVAWREREKAREWGYEGWEQIDEQYVESAGLRALRHAYAWRHRELHRYMKAVRENQRDTVVVCPLCAGRTVVMRRRRAAA